MEKATRRARAEEAPAEAETREPIAPRPLPGGLRQFYGLHEAAPGGARPSAPTSGGSALPGDLRKKMETSFSADFAPVRVHDGSEAAARHGALAFAQGEHLHFRSGAYQPSSASGQKLIGHELAHVLQQRAGRVPDEKEGVNSDPALEAEAEAAGEAASRGEPAHVAGGGKGSAPATVLQRAVGFEFEVSRWETARVLDPGAELKRENSFSRDHATGGKLNSLTPTQGLLREQRWKSHKPIFSVRDAIDRKKEPRPLGGSDPYSLANRIRDVGEGAPKVKLDGIDLATYEWFVSDKFWVTAGLEKTPDALRALAALIKEAGTAPPPAENQQELDALDEGAQKRDANLDYEQLLAKGDQRTPVEEALFKELGAKGAAKKPEGELKSERALAPLKKKDHLLTGDGFSLQADEVSSGTTDLEIVTEPFDEAAGGLERLTQVMANVDAVANALRGRKEPLPSSELAAFGVPRAGTVIFPSPTLTANMQMSAAIRPSMIPTLMKQLGAPGEEVGERQRLGPGRRAMAGNVEGMPTLGEAAGWASTAVAQWSKQALETELKHRERLEGLVAMLAQYLVTAIGSPDMIGYPKTIGPLMARTDFATYFAIAVEKAAMPALTAKDGRAFVELVLAAARLSNRKNDFSPDADVFEHGAYRAQPDPRLSGKLMAGLTRGQWLSAITQGVDLLTAKNFPNPEGKEHLESMGAMGDLTGEVGNKKRYDAPILEFRSMAAPDLDSKVWFTRTLNLFEYVVKLNRGSYEAFSGQGETDEKQAPAREEIIERVNGILGGKK